MGDSVNCVCWIPVTEAKGKIDLICEILDIEDEYFRREKADKFYYVELDDEDNGGIDKYLELAKEGIPYIWEHSDGIEYQGCNILCLDKEVFGVPMTVQGMPFITFDVVDGVVIPFQDDIDEVLDFISALHTFVSRHGTCKGVPEFFLK
jgi:hypothetical protein